MTAPRRAPGRRTGLLARGPRGPRGRAPVVALVAGCIAVAAALNLSGSAAVPRTTPAAAAGPTVPAPDAVSATWYCAEGTGSPGGRADETIWIANVGDTDARADVTVMPGGNNAPSSRRVTVPKRAQLRVPVSSVLEAAEQVDQAGTIVGPGVVVEVFGGRSVVEHEIDGQNDVAVGPCARQPGRNWFFAAGTTERGAEQNLSLFNPFADDAIVDLSFVTDAGFVAPAELQSLVVPRRSRVTVPIGNFVRRQAQVGVRVRVRTGRVVAEQSLAFTSEHETRRGLTLSLGATEQARSWTLPGVASEDGATHALFVANFDAAATQVEVAPRFEDENTVSPTTVPVGGMSAAIIDLGPLVAPGVLFAVQVRTTHDTPIVVEELASWGSPAVATGSAAALGSPVAARAWAFAVSRLGPEGATTVSVLNPGRHPATISLLAYESGRLDRPASAPEFAVPPGKQVTFDLRELEVAPDQVVVVRADMPVVAARRIFGATGVSLAPGVPDPYNR